MYQNACTFPLATDLFCQTTHPTEPVLVAGLASGHVQCLRLPAVDSPQVGKGVITTLWSTKRHKGSCRGVSFLPDGSYCYSAGTDGIVKHFSSETGQVVTKIRLGAGSSILSPSLAEQPTVVKAFSPETLLIGGEEGAVYLYDLRDGSGQLHAKPRLTLAAHDEYVSSIKLLPGTVEENSSAHQFVTTGGATVAVSDVRKGVLVQSEEQDDELVCSTFVPGVGSKKNRNGGMFFVGTGSGALTMWDRGRWHNQQGRVHLNQNESVDTIATVPDTCRVMAGFADGQMVLMNCRTKKVEGVFSHDGEGVMAIDFECQGRVISGGGTVIKIWEEAHDTPDEGETMSDSNDSEEHDSEDDGDDGETKRKRLDESNGDSSDDEKPRKRKKKAKGKKPKRFKSGAQHSGAYGHHGIMGFSNL